MASWECEWLWDGIVDFQFQYFITLCSVGLFIATWICYFYTLRASLVLKAETTVMEGVSPYPLPSDIWYVGIDTPDQAKSKTENLALFFWSSLRGSCDNPWKETVGLGMKRHSNPRQILQDISMLQPFYPSIESLSIMFCSFIPSAKEMRSSNPKLQKTPAVVFGLSEPALVDRSRAAFMTLWRANKCAKCCLNCSVRFLSQQFRGSLWQNRISSRRSSEEATDLLNALAASHPHSSQHTSKTLRWSGGCGWGAFFSETCNQFPPISKASIWGIGQQARVNRPPGLHRAQRGQ